MRVIGVTSGPSPCKIGQSAVSTTALQLTTNLGKTSSTPCLAPGFIRKNTTMRSPRRTFQSPCPCIKVSNEQSVLERYYLSPFCTTGPTPHQVIPGGHFQS